MATKTKAKTVADRKAELEKQLEDLEVLECIEEAINDYKERAERELKGYTHYDKEVGKEPEQARNYNGELLYEVEGKRWNTYTEETLKELELTPDSDGVTPYHRPIYESTPYEEGELGTWAKRRIEAYTRVIKFLDRYLEEA